MNWDDPEARARFIERVGPDAYNAAHLQHMRDSTVETVNGHGIRKVRSARFGLIFMVDGTNSGSQTIEGAREIARKAGG